jgi:hypothetical protein
MTADPDARDALDAAIDSLLLTVERLQISPERFAALAMSVVRRFAAEGHLTEAQVLSIAAGFVEALQPQRRTT